MCIFSPSSQSRPTASTFEPGRLFKAGKDSTGKDAFFANIADFVANKAVIAAKKTVYRHGAEAVGLSSPHPKDEGRIFASPVADSGDGNGAPLTSPDKSWQPFFNKVYVDGVLSEIAMPEAAVGFAVASHYLLMAEGTRQITVRLTTAAALPAGFKKDHTRDVRCYLTSAKGWIEKTPAEFVVAVIQPPRAYCRVDRRRRSGRALFAQGPRLQFRDDAASAARQLVQDDTRPYGYATLQDLKIATIELIVVVNGMKTLAASNDFGPIDLSKPFQPFGSSPATGSSLVIGSKEIFQKQLGSASIDVTWQIPPVVSILRRQPEPFPQPTSISSARERGRRASIRFPIASSGASPGSATDFALSGSSLTGPTLDVPDFSANEAYGTQSRQGFVRLRLSGGIGQSDYQSALIDYIKGGQTGSPPTPPQVPVAAALTMSYMATSTLNLETANAADFAARKGQFFHLAPFGTAEQHPASDGRRQCHALAAVLFRARQHDARERGRILHRPFWACAAAKPVGSI